MNYLNNTANTGGANANVNWVLYLDSNVTTNGIGITSNVNFALEIINVGTGNLNVSLAANGSLLTLGPTTTVTGNPRDIRVTVGEDITLVGRTNGVNGATANNNAPLVVVNRARFTLDGKLTGNTYAPTAANVTAGVNVTQYGEFILNGAITGNTMTGGTYAGVSSAVNVIGIFTMDDGEIANNTTTGTGANISAVNIANGGQFSMTGDSKITGNSTTGTGAGISGAVNVTSGGTFTMDSGQITGNGTTGASGDNSSAGVVTAGKFIMNTGQITGNVLASETAHSSARGVAVSVTGTTGSFEMYGGSISANTSNNYVASVFIADNVAANAFIMGGGAHIDSVTLRALNNTGNTRIDIESSLTAVGGIDALNLAGNNNTMQTSINYWITNNRIIIAPYGTYTLVATDASKIVLNNFIGNTLAVTQPIASAFPAYEFVRDGANYKLQEQ
jgi:hypothetical protein